MDIKDLLVMASAMRPKEAILEDLAEAVKEAQLGYNEDADKELAIRCQMYLIHTMTGGDLEKAIQLTKDMDKEAKERSFFKPGNN